MGTLFHKLLSYAVLITITVVGIPLLLLYFPTGHN